MLLIPYYFSICFSVSIGVNNLNTVVDSGSLRQAAPNILTIFQKTAHIWRTRKHSSEQINMSKTLSCPKPRLRAVKFGQRESGRAQGTPMEHYQWLHIVTIELELEVDWLLWWRPLHLNNFSKSVRNLRPDKTYRKKLIPEFV